MPLLITITEVAKWSDTFLHDFAICIISEKNSNMISTVILTKFRESLTELIDFCQKNYKEDVNQKQLILLLILVGIAAIAATSYIMILFIVLKVIKQKQESLAIFAFISTEEIGKIIEISSKVSKEKLQGQNFRDIYEDVYIKDENKE